METIESMEPEILDESAESCETCCGLSRQTWGWALVGSGALTALSLLLRRNRWPLDWLVPLGLAGGGAALLLKDRQVEIGEAEQRVAAELDALDPLARVQLLKRVAARELRRRKTSSEPNDES